MRVACLSLLLAVLLAACGGGNVTVEQAPGPPVTLTEPGNPAELAPTATPTATATAGVTAAATPTPTPTPAGGTGTTGTGSTGTSTGSTGTTGGTGTGTQTGSTGTSTQPPPAGSDAQKFEQFCAQNPGAC